MIPHCIIETKRSVTESSDLNGVCEPLGQRAYLSVLGFVYLPLLILLQKILKDFI